MSRYTIEELRAALHDKHVTCYPCTVNVRVDHLREALDRLEDAEELVASAGASWWPQPAPLGNAGVS